MLQKLKEDHLQFRRDPNFKIQSTVLTTLLGEIQTESKKLNIDLDDTKIIKIISKFIKNIDESLKLITDPFKCSVLDLEKQLLESYLPSKLTLQELETIVSDIILNLDKSSKNLKKLLLTELSSKYPNKFSTQEVFQILDKLLKS